MKICKDCKIEKELNAFHRADKWYRNRCKKCHNLKYQPATGMPNAGRFKKGQLPATAFKPGNIPWNKGKPVSEEMRKHLSGLQKGRKQSPEEIDKRRRSLIKEWDAYVTYQRHSAASSRWSREVRKRDGFRCKQCGESSKRLHAHHIVSWKENKMLRHEISNGITLCIPCHHKIHANDIRIAWNKGKKLSEEHKKNLSVSHRRYNGNK